MSNSDKTALYTAVTLLKGVIMERALLMSSDTNPTFLKAIDRATDALISDLYTQTNDRWEFLARRGMPKVESVWEGVFDTFAEAGGDKDVFTSAEWIQKTKEKTIEAIKADTQSRDYPLSPIIAMLIDSDDFFTVLDFGGGMGLQYLDVRKKVPRSFDNLRYHILDNPEIINNVPAEIKAMHNVKFHVSTDTIKDVISLVHFGSVLQYLEDAHLTIRHVTAECLPTYFVFSDLVAGDIPTFVTHQLYRGKKIPVRFLNIHGVLALMNELGFHLIYESKFIAPICGKEQEYPNSALPDKYRIDRTVNLVFSRAG